MKKKVMALALSAVMALSTVPWEAAAAEPRPDPGEEIVEVVEEEAAAPAAVEEETPADVVEAPDAVEAPAEEPADSVVLDGGLEIAEIAEVGEEEVPEEAVENTAVSEPEEVVELMADGASEPEEIAGEYDPTKTPDTAYGESDGANKPVKSGGKLTVQFRDIAEEANDTLTTVADGRSKMVTLVENSATNEKYYYMETGRTAVYDPTDELPELQLMWTEDGGAQTVLVKNTDSVDPEESDYSYRLVENTDGNVGHATIEITFRNDYRGIDSPLRLGYTIIKKQLKDAKDAGKLLVSIEQTNTDPENQNPHSSDNAYHFEYTGEDQRPEVTKVTYKKGENSKDLQRTNETVQSKLDALTGDWYTVTGYKRYASENLKESNWKNGDGLAGGDGTEVYGQSGTRYYVLTIKGYGNYTGTITYKFVIDQKDVKDGDIVRPDNATFYVGLDEYKVNNWIDDNLVNKREEKPLKDTEPDGTDPYSYQGYVIHYYKIVEGKEVPFTSKNFPNVWGVNDEGTSAPGSKDASGKRVDSLKGDAYTEAVHDLIGKYTYKIEFTGTGNFKKKAANAEPVIGGSFRIVDDEPQLMDVYNSIERELVKALNDTLNPTYDATDWIVREGGSDDDPNDVTEMIKSVFNQYPYTKKGPDGKPINCKAGDNIKVSLKPGESENGKMIDVKEDGYIIRIRGIKDWAEQGYIDMDGDDVTYVEARSLEFDNGAVPSTSTMIDCFGKGASVLGDYLDRFYIANGSYAETDAGAVEKYTAATDPYREGDIYKYGAVQYLARYKESAWDLPEVTITHLVRDTEDTAVKDYPLAEDQYENPVNIKDTAGDFLRAREKKLEPNVDYTIGATTSDGKWTTITGMKNYKGTITLPTIRKKQVNLATNRKEADGTPYVQMRIKTITEPLDKPDGVHNSVENAVYEPDPKKGLDLRYLEGGGINVLRENIEVRYRNAIVDPEDYLVLIDENGICSRCRDLSTELGTIGEGRHVHVGKHAVMVKGTGSTNCTGFNEVEFYINGADFDKDYTAEWDKDKMEAAGFDPEKTLVVGQKIDVKMAPHNFVKVRSTTSDNVVLNYQQEYVFDCYIPAERKADLMNGTLEEKDKININVRGDIEFQKAGKWTLAIKPMNTTSTKVEQYEGYLFFDFEVNAKEFNSEWIKVKVNDSITWPGHNITGMEISKILRVEDAQKILDTELEYGKDYTIEGTVDTVGEKVPVTLKGMGNYSGESFDVDITVNRASMEGATVELTLTGKNLFAYKGEAFTAEDKIDSSSVKVTTATETMVDPKDYTVTAVSEAGGSDAGTKVTVTVKAVEEEGKGHYTGTANPVETVITQADISTDLFELVIPKEPQVYKGTPVTLPEVKLIDTRTGKDVVIEDPTYEGNDDEGPATVTVKAKNPEGKENYTDDSKSAEFQIKLDPTCLAGAAVEVLDKDLFAYKGEAFTAEDEIDSNSVKVTTLAGNVVSADNYEVTVEGGSEVGDEVKITVTAKDGSLYTESAETTGTVTPADINNEAIFKLEGVMDMIYKGEAVTLPDLKLVDTRTGKEVAIEEPVYAGNDGEGTATVTVKAENPEGKENYTDDPLTKEFQIKLDPTCLTGATVELLEDALAYTGEAFNGKLDSSSVKVTTLAGNVVSADNYEATAEGGSEVGDEVKVTVTPKDGSLYTESAETTGTITQADINNEAIFKLEGVMDMIYKGEAVTQPDLKLTDMRTGKEIRINDAYADNDGEGLATVTVTPVDTKNYKGEITREFQLSLDPMSLAGATVELLEDALAYTGEAFDGKLDSSSVKVTTLAGGVVPADNYEVTVEGGSEVGDEVKVTVTPKDGSLYTDSAETTGTVTQADISNEALFELAGVVDKVYKGTAVTQDLKLTDTRTGKEIKVETAYTDNDKAGTATVTVTPADTKNYTGTVTAEFRLADQNLKDVVLKNGGVFPYKEAAYTAEDVIQAVYDADGDEIAKGRYTAEIVGNAKDAGKAAVAVTVKVDGKDVTIEKSFTISPKAITEVTNLQAEYVYNGGVIRPDVTVVAGKQILQNKDYVIYNTESAEVGAKELAVQGIGNYSGNILKKFTVVPESVAGAGVTGVKASYKYNGTVRVPKVKVTVNGKVLKKDVDYVVKATESAEIGAKELVIEGTGNYTGSLTKSFNVMPAKAAVEKVTAKANKLVVNVKEQTGASYQIQYRVEGSKGGWSSAKASGTKKVLKGLKSGKKYEIRVRASAEINGERVNGKWSKVTVSKKVK